MGEELDTGELQKYEEPKVSMEFADTEAAYDFYNKYAFHVGFSVRKNKIRKNKVDIPTYRTFCCYKEGTCKKPSASKSPPKYQ
jgi:FAR1 DNA-binding domain